MSRSSLLHKRPNEILIHEEGQETKHKKQKTDINLPSLLSELFPQIKDRNDKKSNKQHCVISKFAKHISYATIIYYLVKSIQPHAIVLSQQEINRICWSLYSNIQEDIRTNSHQNPFTVFKIIGIKFVNYIAKEYNVSIDVEDLIKGLPHQFLLLTQRLSDVLQPQKQTVFKFENNTNLNFPMRLVCLMDNHSCQIILDGKEDKDTINLNLEFDKENYSLWNIFYTFRQLNIMHFIPKLYENVKFYPYDNGSGVTITSDKYILDHLFSTIPLLLSLRHLDSPSSEHSNSSRLLFSPIHIGPFARKIARLFMSTRKFDQWLAVRFISVLFSKDTRRDTKNILDTLPNYQEQLKPFFINLKKTILRMCPLLSSTNLYDYMMTLSAVIDLNSECQCITFEGLARLIQIFNNKIDHQDKLTTESKERLMYLKFIIEDTLYTAVSNDDKQQRRTWTEKIRNDTIQKQIRTRILYMQGDIRWCSVDNGKRLFKWSDNPPSSPIILKNSRDRFGEDQIRLSNLCERNTIITDLLDKQISFPKSYRQTRWTTNDYVDPPKGTSISYCITDTHIELLGILADEELCSPEDVLFVFTNMYDKFNQRTKVFTKCARSPKHLFKDLKTFHGLCKHQDDGTMSPTDEEDAITNHIASLMAFRYLYNINQTSKKCTITETLLNKTAQMMIEPVGETSHFFTTDNETGKYQKIRYVLPMAISPPDKKSCFIFDSILGESFGQLIVMMNEMDC